MVDLQVKYNCKVLPFGLLGTVSIAVSIAMSITFISTFLGANAIFTTVVMVGLMYLVILFLSTEATFTIRENGLERMLLSSNFIFKHQLEKRYAWENIKAYKNGTDKGRYRGEYRYLEIKFRNGDEWKITDMYGERKDTYTNFLDFFLKQVELFNQTNKVTVLSKMETAHSPVSSPQKQLTIERKKTFYESIWGKIFTVSLGFFILALLIYAKSYMSATSLFKMYCVLIPGFMYMFYRTFINKYR